MASESITPIEMLATKFEGKWIRVNEPTKIYIRKDDFGVDKEQDAHTEMFIMNTKHSQWNNLATLRHPH